VPKSTLSVWLSRLQLDESVKKQLVEKKKKIIEQTRRRRVRTTLKAIREIDESSARQVGTLGKRDLWLSGILVYWVQRMTARSRKDEKRYVTFSSSDETIIKLFLKWLLVVGGLANDELRFDVYAGRDQREYEAQIKKYWAGVLNVAVDKISRVYWQRGSLKIKRRKTQPRAKMGHVRIMVKDSFLLHRQIRGWSNTIIKQLIGPDF
jgi:hypothetical protein